jgi:hypothetical protein
MKNAPTCACCAKESAVRFLRRTDNGFGFFCGDCAKKQSDVRHIEREVNRPRWNITFEGKSKGGYELRTILEEIIAGKRRRTSRPIRWEKRFAVSASR